MAQREVISLADESITDEEKQRVSDNLRKKEQAPSARLQSESYQFFMQTISELGSPYDATHIPISTLKQMERDPMLAFGLHFIRTPLMRAKWRVNCERADIASFVDNAFRRIRSRLMVQYSGSWNYGFKPVVKRFALEKPDWTFFDAEVGEEKPVWDHGNVEATVWKHFISLPSDPDKVELKWKNGEFDGFKYTGAMHSPTFPFMSNSESGSDTRVDLQHALWFTNERDSVNGSLYGYPRVGYAYRFWWSFWFRWALFDRFFERKADPPYYIYFPTEGSSADFINDPDSGDRVSMRDIALSIAEQAKSGGAVAMPGALERGYDDRPTNQRQWELGEIEMRGSFDNFIENFNYLDTMKLRSLWIPEQALIEGAGGQSSRNVAKEELSVLRESQENIAEEFDEHINRYVIPDIVNANFPEFDGSCMVETTGFAKADTELQSQIIQAIAQNDVGALQEIDLRELLDQNNLPLISMKEMKRREEEAIKAVEEETPPPIAPQPGQAGVNQQGLYVTPRNTIILSDDDFSSRVPDSVHYKDKAVMAQGKAIQAEWNRLYKDVYTDFASYLKKLDTKEVGLAEESPIDKIMKGWKFSKDKVDEIVDQSTSRLDKTVRRAALLAMKNFDIDRKWKPDRDTVSEYLADRGAELVKAIDETTRQELRDFLSRGFADGKDIEQIAKEIDENFSEFPGWKSVRLARTEIRNAYNFATIDASDAAGIKQMRAADAQLGEDRSDPECIERNNKVFGIQEALKVTIDEHPNGTLAWKPLKTSNLSIKITDDIPGIPKALAAYDEDTETIYFKNDIPEQVEESYLEQILNTLQL